MSTRAILLGRASLLAVLLAAPARAEPESNVERDGTHASDAGSALQRWLVDALSRGAELALRGRGVSLLSP